jgi:hypothetical protein
MKGRMAYVDISGQPRFIKSRVSMNWEIQNLRKIRDILPILIMQSQTCPHLFGPKTMDLVLSAYEERDYGLLKEILDDNKQEVRQQIYLNKVGRANVTETKHDLH